MEDSSSENLDDGELWLPSDIFPVEEPAVPCNNKLTCSFCCCYSCLLHHRDDHRSFFMAEQGKTAAAAAASVGIGVRGTDESIIQRVAALSLLQQQHQPHTTHSVLNEPFPITERFRPIERCSCTDRGGRGELLRTGPPPVYPYRFNTPVQLQHQVESLMEARARFIQMEEQNRLIRMQRRNPGLNRFAGNRFSPFVGAAAAGGGGGFNGESSSVRDYGGTGVFLPRVPTTNNIDNNGRKIQGGRNRQDVQQNGQRYPCI